MPDPRVTVIISVRESHWLSEESLKTVLADDSIPFDLIYLDVMSPPPVARMIQDQARTHGFKVVRHDAWIAPAQARKRVIPGVRTPYVAFVDNDVLVERGCLERLVDCADETGAGLVGPIYLQAGAGRPLTIHMAGGTLTWTDAEPKAMTGEYHALLGEPAEKAGLLARRAVDFVEYHYTLARTDLVQRPGAISDDILLVHEHIDLALFAKEQGLSTMFEPSARVTYLAFRPQRLQDLAFYRRRWDSSACEESLRAFAKRWPVDQQSGMYDPVRHFVQSRLGAAEFAREGPPGNDLGEPMQPQELAQTRFALRQQALARGYGAPAIQALESSCDFAMLIFNGLYRPDGRPFLNHALGTASALLRYEFRIDIVIAGLLHAAYTHRPDWMPVEEVTRVLQSGGEVDRMVRQQPKAAAYALQGAESPGLLAVDEAQGLCIRAANEADMLLSGEYQSTGRKIEFTPEGVSLLEGAMTYLGRQGLARTASQPAGEGVQGPLLGIKPLTRSFRLDAQNRRVEWVQIRA